MLAQHRILFCAGLLTIFIFYTGTAFAASGSTSNSNSTRQDAGEVIKSGLAAYEKGELGTATQQLTYALQLVNEKYGELIAMQMPAVLKGWKTQKARHQTSAMMLGGGVSVKQVYSKGTAKVDIQILKDSPMLQSLMMVMSNPMMMGMDGGRMLQLNGYNALVKYKDTSQRGELSIIVENRFLVLMKSKKTTEDDLLAYAEAINFAGLKKLLK